MAYKFQLGAASMSGSLVHEVDRAAMDAESGIVLEAVGGGVLAMMSASGDLSASAGLFAGGSVRLDGVADTAVAVGSDSFYFLDSDGFMKRESLADYASAIAGDGLAASSGALAVGVDDSTVELNSDALRVKAAGITATQLATSVAGNGLAGGGGSALSLDLNELSAAAVAVAADSIAIIDADDNSSKKESIADLMTAVAGNGLAASSGVLAVGVDDSTVELNSDALRVKAAGITEAHLNTSVAGVGLSGGGGTALAVDLNELGGASIASGDSFAFIDATDSNASKKETVDDLATLFAGQGMAASSAVIAIANATNGGMQINASSIQVDLNDLAAASVAVAADSIAIIDADDNSTKKESIADLATAMAGAGITASNGVFSIDGSTPVGVGNENATLAEGFTFGNATLTADRTWTLPDDPSDGDIVRVKAPANVAGYKIIISKDGGTSHTIDGQATIELETAGAAVSLMYVGGNAWLIF